MRSDRWRIAGALAAAVMLLAVMVPTVAQAGHGNCVIDVTPESDTNVLGQTHTLTATLRPSGTNVNVDQTARCARHDDVVVSFEVEGNSGATYTPASVDQADTGANDLSCTIARNDNDDACSVSYTRTSTTGRDEIVASLADAASVTDTVLKDWIASSGAFLNITPETDTNPLDTEHTLTATVRSAAGALSSGVRVDLEVMDGPNEDLDGESDEPDLSCTTGSSGTCTVAYTDDEAVSGQTDTICGWLDADNDDVFDTAGAAADGGDCDEETNAESEDSSVGGTDTFGNDVTDRVTKMWSSSATSGGTLLDVTPETDTNPLRTSHTLTAEVRTATGALVSGARVDFELMTGPNDDLDNDSDDVDRTCTTGSNGQCTVTYTDATATTGQVDTLCAWLDTDNDENFSTAGDTSDGGDCDNEANSEGEGSNAWGTDATDRVTKTWSGTATGAIYLNVVPEEEENEIRDEHELTAVARNSSGGVVSGVEVDFEIIDGPNEDLDSDDPDMECTTDSSGTCEVSYDDESAAVGDIDEICAWIDTDRDDDFDDDGARNDGGDCDDEDNDETEDSSRSGTDAFGNDDTDLVRKEWVASSDAFYLNLDPERARNEPGTSHSVTAVAHDRDGNLAVGVSIDFEIISGPNANIDNAAADPDFECTTNDSGACAITYTDGSTNPAGNMDTICGWLDIEDDDDFSKSGGLSDGGACDEETLNEPEDSGRPGNDTFGNDATDTVAKTWGTGNVPTPCQVEGAIVGTSGPDTLIGTTGNDVICGLGSGDTILGYGGHDLILAGRGADNIRGGGGSDGIRAGAGNDYAAGQGGNDTIRGGDGDDYLLGGSGNDTLRGGDGTDAMDGGRHVDLCGGGRGRDRRIRCEA